MFLKLLELCLVQICYHTVNSGFATQTTSTPKHPNVVLSANISNETQENVNLLAGFMNCYKAFMECTFIHPSVMSSDLEQIHAHDVEEMEVT